MGICSSGSSGKDWLVVRLVVYLRTLSVVQFVDFWGFFCFLVPWYIFLLVRGWYG